MNHKMPWQLRLSHKGSSHIQMEWNGKKFHFDPSHPVEDGEVVILLWNWPQRIQATVKSLRSGKRLIVIAPQVALDWLSQYGTFEGYSNNCVISDIEFELTPYEPIPPLTLSELANKVKGGIRNGITVAKQIYRKRGMPRFQPHICQVTFPNGSRLLHLNLSLHKYTSIDWFSAQKNALPNINWAIVGCDYRHDEAMLQLIHKLPIDKILLTDLIGDARRNVGMPVQLLTPIADKAITQNLEVYVFAPHVSFRFD